MNLDRISLFAHVARLKSFSAAARERGLSPAAVSKQVMLLEDELGVKLLHRTTRNVTLTEEGQTFFLRANAALAELTEAVQLAGEQQNTPRGTLRISAPVTFGHRHMLPVFAGFAEAFPDILLDVSFDDRMVDAISEGYDVVIRVGPLHDSSMMMESLGLCPLTLVASPTYLAKHPTLSTPADLKHHRIIGFSQHGGAFEWSYQAPDGQQGHLRAECTFRTNSADMMLAAALQHQGVALLPSFVLNEALASKQLVHVLPTFTTIPLRQVVALTPPTRHRTAKVQAFLTYLTKTFPKHT